MKMTKDSENGTDNLSIIYKRHDKLGVDVNIVFFRNIREFVEWSNLNCKFL